VGQSFLIADGPGLPPRRRRKVPLRRWLRVPPLAGGPRFPLRRVARGFLAPKARDLPLPVAPRPLKPVDLRCPVAGWLRVPPGRWPGVSRCRVAPDLPEPEGPEMPVADGSGLPPRRVAQSFLCAGWLRVALGPAGPRSSPLPGGSGSPSYQWPEALPLPGGSGVSPIASGSGFPLRRLPFPVVKKFLRLFVRGAQEVCATNFKILWPSTSHPQLTPSCPPRQAFCPPNTPQSGPQASRAGLHPRAGYRPANLSSGSRASLT